MYGRISKRLAAAAAGRGRGWGCRWLASAWTAWGAAATDVPPAA
eukprot:COSAG01_NODE_65331_length_273_cov_1.471264_1_plen_43_part_10